MWGRNSTVSLEANNSCSRNSSVAIKISSSIFSYDHNTSLSNTSLSQYTGWPLTDSESEESDDYVYPINKTKNILADHGSNPLDSNELSMDLGNLKLKNLYQLEDSYSFKSTNHSDHDTNIWPTSKSELPKLKSRGKLSEDDEPIWIPHPSKAHNQNIKRFKSVSKQSSIHKPFYKKELPDSITKKFGMTVISSSKNSQNGLNPLIFLLYHHKPFCGHTKGVSVDTDSREEVVNENIRVVSDDEYMAVPLRLLKKPHIIFQSLTDHQIYLFPMDPIMNKAADGLANAGPTSLKGSIMNRRKKTDVPETKIMH
uniref:Uncharacterized protein n=1 Tax=Timema bartmani TaxID=61472 RepID=A0A7R9F7E3_9NEOP|nr:unnamed protein product [Timema bartmani]